MSRHPMEQISQLYCFLFDERLPQLFPELQSIMMIKKLDVPGEETDSTMNFNVING